MPFFENPASSFPRNLSEKLLNPWEQRQRQAFFLKRHFPLFNAITNHIIWSKNQDSMLNHPHNTLILHFKLFQPKAYSRGVSALGGDAPRVQTSTGLPRHSFTR